jgi:heat-inducible transcriptional repressor
MTDRQLRILASLVAEYIEQGEPVSSAWLASHSALGLSSATVRNILARLEDQGLVRQPHTSAGRIPTDSGYRLYVDFLLTSRRQSRALPEVEARLRRSGTVGELLEHASQELSRASHQIGFAVVPASQSIRLQRVEFVRLEGCRVLVVLLGTGGHASHRVIDTEEPYDTRALEQAAAYINREFVGLTLDEARAALVRHLQEERMLYDVLMRRALTLAQAGLSQVRTEDRLHVQGTSYLVDGLAGEPADRQRTLDTLRALLQMIEEKHQLVDLLSRAIEAGGLTVLIGSENPAPGLHPFSMVVSRFRDDTPGGAIGVIGPTRMRYERAITLVDGVSRAVTRVLDGQ